MSQLTPTDFKELGVYEPGAPHAAERLELLQYLVGLGATADDLVAYREELPGLAMVVAIRGEGVLTLSEAAERAGISREKLSQVSRAAGFPEPGPEDRVISEQFAGLAAGGEIVAPAAVARAAGVEGESLGPQVLKGVDEHIELCRVVGR